MLSSELVLPQEGHLIELFQVFSYLKKHINTEMVFNSYEPRIDMDLFQCQEWTCLIYSTPGEELKECLPPNIPTQLGKGFTVRCCVNADRAGELLTRRLKTGYIVLLNNAPVYWLTKKMTSIETRTVGSEFMAMEQATEYLLDLRYTLMMCGIPVDEPVFVYDDNQSVLVNSSMPGSTLKKKSQSIVSHPIFRNYATDEWRTIYVNASLNVDELITKPLVEETRWSVVRIPLHHI